MDRVGNGDVILDATLISPFDRVVQSEFETHYSTPNATNPAVADKVRALRKGTPKDSDQVITVLRNPVGNDVWKLVRVPGFNISFKLGEVTPGVGYVDVYVTLSAPTYLIHNSARYAQNKSWTIEIEPSQYFSIIGDGIAQFLNYNDSNHSSAQFLIRQAVKFLKPASNLQFQLNVYFEIATENLDEHEHWETAYPITMTLLITYVIRKALGLRLT